MDIWMSVNMIYCAAVAQENVSNYTFQLIYSLFQMHNDKVLCDFHKVMHWSTQATYGPLKTVFCHFLFFSFSLQ